jgi:hypothetical protein
VKCTRQSEAQVRLINVSRRQPFPAGRDRRDVARRTGADRRELRSRCGRAPARASAVGGLGEPAAPALELGPERLGPGRGLEHLKAPPAGLVDDQVVIEGQPEGGCFDPRRWRRSEHPRLEPGAEAVAEPADPATPGHRALGVLDHLGQIVEPGKGVVLRCGERERLRGQDRPRTGTGRTPRAGSHGSRRRGTGRLQPRPGQRDRMAILGQRGEHPSEISAAGKRDPPGRRRGENRPQQHSAQLPRRVTSCSLVTKPRRRDSCEIDRSNPASSKGTSCPHCSQMR